MLFQYIFSHDEESFSFLRLIMLYFTAELWRNDKKKGSPRASFLYFGSVKIQHLILNLMGAGLLKIPF